MAELASCPKCGTGKTDAPACPRCGLVAERWEGFAATRDAEAPDVLIAAWDRAALAWDDPALHDEVMRLVAQHDAYAWAAARYRTRAGDPVGDRQLARVRRAAEATMLAGASARADKTPKPYRAATTVLVMLIVAAIAGLLYATISRNPGAKPPGAVTPAQPIKNVAPTPAPTKK